MHRLLDYRSSISTDLNLAEAESGFESHVESICSKFQARASLINEEDLRHADYVMAKHAVCDAIFQHITAHAALQTSNDFATLINELRSIYMISFEEIHQVVGITHDRVLELQEVNLQQSLGKFEMCTVLYTECFDGNYTNII